MSEDNYLDFSGLRKFYEKLKTKFLSKDNLSEIKGEPGEPGVSITNIEQTITSTADSGENVITVSLSDGVTNTFKIKNGSKGSTGAAAGFGTPTATVDTNVGTPSVVITSSGSNTAKIFNFAFKNLKGETGAKGDTGATGAKGDKGDTPSWKFEIGTDGHLYVSY